MNYKNIIFDFGNVLATFSEDKIIGNYCSSPEDFVLMKQAVFYSWDEMDKGTIDYDAYMKHVASILPDHLQSAIAELSRSWYQQLTPMEETWNFVKELKEKGYSVYILSNAPTFFADHADFFPITKEFDGIVFSGPLKIAKPEPAIYEYLFDTYCLKPEECLFLDDKKKNVDAAQKLGMDGIVFTGDIEVVKNKLR